MKKSQGRERSDWTFHYLSLVDVINKNDKSFLLVGLVEGKTHKILYHIFDIKGNFIDYFNGDYETIYIVGIYQDQIYCINREKFSENPDYNFIEIYKIKY